MKRESRHIQDYEICCRKITPAVILEVCLIIAAVGFTAYFLIFWLFSPSWVHFEFRDHAPSYFLRPEESFFSSLIESTLNLKLTEDGYYRPRYLNFLIQYIDSNVSLAFYKEYPELGVKLPSYAFSIVTTVAAFVCFWRSLFPKDGYGMALIGGASLLYYDVYMNTSFMVLRGGKFLVTAAALVCLTVFVRHRHRHFVWRQLGYCAGISWVLFFLATMDEMLAAVVFFVAGLTLVISCIEKKWYQSTVIFVLAAINYFLYYLYWGRWLFAKFTEGGIQAKSHYHQFADVLRVDFTVIAKAVEMLLSNVSALGASSYILFFVLAGSLYNVLQQRNRAADQLSICAFVVFPVILTTFLVSSHPAIYNMQILWNLLYLALPVHGVAIAASYALYLSNSHTTTLKVMLAIAFVGICTMGVHKMHGSYRSACEITSRYLDSSACGENPVFPGE